MIISFNITLQRSGLISDSLVSIVKWERILLYITKKSEYIWFSITNICKKEKKWKK